MAKPGHSKFPSQPTRIEQDQNQNAQPRVIRTRPPPAPAIDFVLPLLSCTFLNLSSRLCLVGKKKKIIKFEDLKFSIL